MPLSINFSRSFFKWLVWAFWRAAFSEGEFNEIISAIASCLRRFKYYVLMPFDQIGINVLSRDRFDTTFFLYLTTRHGRFFTVTKRSSVNCYSGSSSSSVWNHHRFRDRFAEWRMPRGQILTYTKFHRKWFTSICSSICIKGVGL